MEEAFHDENGNYGITNFLWDRLLGTHYAEAEAVARSETVFDLGYAGAERERYPWVMGLSQAGGDARVTRDAGGDS